MDKKALSAAHDYSAILRLEAIAKKADVRAAHIIAARIEMYHQHRPALYNPLAPRAIY